MDHREGGPTPEASQTSGNVTAKDPLTLFPGASTLRSSSEGAICLSVCLCMFVCMLVCLSRFVHMRVSMYAWLRVYQCVSLCLCVYVYSLTLASVTRE